MGQRALFSFLASSATMKSLPPVPDFEAVSRSYVVTAEESIKVGNLPAVGGGPETQEPIRRLELQLRETAREQ